MLLKKNHEIALQTLERCPPLRNLDEYLETALLETKKECPKGFAW